MPGWPWWASPTSSSRPSPTCVSSRSPSSTRRCSRWCPRGWIAESRRRSPWHQPAWSSWGCCSGPSTPQRATGGRHFCTNGDLPSSASGGRIDRVTFRAMPSFTGRPMGQVPDRRRRRSSRRHPVVGPAARPASTRRAGPHWIRRILLLTTAGLLTVLVGTATLLYTYAGELPSLDHLSAQSLPQTTRIYARDGVTLLEERYQQRRTVVPLNNVAWDLRHATIAIEDRAFYNHGAVNPVRLLAAGVYDILHQRAAQGGVPPPPQLGNTSV